MIGGCALNHGSLKRSMRRCGTSMHSGCEQVVTKSSKEQPPNDSRAPLALSGDPEAGPSKPGPEGHSHVGSKISKPPPYMPGAGLWIGLGMVPSSVC